MNWKSMMRRLETILERNPKLSDQTAMVRSGDILYELDIFRSLETGRLHIGPRYPGMDEMPEHTEDAIKGEGEE